jgi:secondary thiamine-phosphate synthase enzyme
MTKASIAVDGASRGNPGPAGIGIVISDDSGHILAEISEYIGNQTNNFAEYTALIRALCAAQKMGFTHVSVRTDSELMSKQINGQYRAKNSALLPLYQSALDHLHQFRSVEITHVPREQNKRADSLAGRAARAGAQPQLIAEVAATPPPPPSNTTLGPSIHQINVRTSSRSQFLDISNDVQDAIRASGVTDGVCTVYVPHTTAGITINENADPDVTRDVIDALSRLVPHSAAYRHGEGNSDSHVKASMMGFSVNVLVEGGRMVLGTWQAIYFCEFDGPRARKVYVRMGK